MQRTFQVTSKLVVLTIVTAVAVAVLAGCDGGAKPMSPQNEAKYKEMMQSGNSAKGSAQMGGGGGSNGPK
jgi:hypothetical protein